MCEFYWSVGLPHSLKYFIVLNVNFDEVNKNISLARIKLLCHYTLTINKNLKIIIKNFF